MSAVEALSPDGTRMKAADLAAVLGTTPGFLTQVMNPLVKARWVRSVPGPTGGYTLTPAGSTVSVLDVIETVDGPTSTGQCVVEDRPCGGSETCVLHAAWAAARATLTSALAQVPAAQWRGGASAPPLST